MKSEDLVTFNRLFGVWLALTVVLLAVQWSKRTHRTVKTAITLLYFSFTQLVKGFAQANIKSWFINSLQNSTVHRIETTKQEVHVVFWEYHVFYWLSYVIKMVFLVNQQLYILCPQFAVDTLVQQYSLQKHMKGKTFK